MAVLVACGGGADSPGEEAATGGDEPVAGAATAEAPMASIRIVSPQDGAEVTSPVLIVMEVEGIEIVPAGDETPRSGHHHLLVDVPVPAAGVPIPTTDGYTHLGQAQTEFELELPPGEHNITAVIGDFAHRVLAPSIEDGVRIIVR